MKQNRILDLTRCNLTNDLIYRTGMNMGFTYKYLCFQVPVVSKQIERALYLAINKRCEEASQELDIASAKRIAQPELDRFYTWAYDYITSTDVVGAVQTGANYKEINDYYARKYNRPTIWDDIKKCLRLFGLLK